MFFGTHTQRRRRARLLKAALVASLGLILLTPRDLSGFARVVESFSGVGSVQAQEVTSSGGQAQRP